MQGVQFQKVQAIIRVPILPSDLKSAEEGLYKHLNEYIGEYIKPLKGLILCYTNIGITDEVGTIIGIDPKVYLRASVEFVVMRVVVGGEISGYLTKKKGRPAELKTHGVISVKIDGEESSLPGRYICTVKRVNIHPFYIHGVDLHRG